MRVGKIESGHTLKYRMALGSIGLTQGGRAPDVVRLMLYRPEFFGHAYTAFLQTAMR